MLSERGEIYVVLHLCCCYTAECHSGWWKSICFGLSGAGLPAAGMAGTGVLPFALRAPGMAAVPLAGHSVSPLSNSALMTADGHVISPQALQLVVSCSISLPCDSLTWLNWWKISSLSDMQAAFLWVCIGLVICKTVYLHDNKSSWDHQTLHRGWSWPQRMCFGVWKVKGQGCIKITFSLQQLDCHNSSCQI